MGVCGRSQTLLAQSISVPRKLLLFVLSLETPGLSTLADPLTLTFVSQSAIIVAVQSQKVVAKIMYFCGRSLVLTTTGLFRQVVTQLYNPTAGSNSIH